MKVKLKPKSVVAKTTALAGAAPSQASGVPDQFRPINVMVKLIPLDRTTPSLRANAGVVSFVNETVVISFGATDPLKQPIPEGDNLTVECPVFMQVTMANSEFVAFLMNFFKSIKNQPARDSVGWSLFAKELSDGTTT